MLNHAMFSKTITRIWKIEKDFAGWNENKNKLVKMVSEGRKKKIIFF
jgi:hypothetical protein